MIIWNTFENQWRKIKDQLLDKLPTGGAANGIAQNESKAIGMLS